MLNSQQTDDYAQHFYNLEHGSLYWFRDWPNQDIPAVACGVYTIWRGEQLIYVGQAGRAAATTSTQRRTGLADRLNHHASGRRSGDQFCVYVCDRLVLPTLTPTQIAEVVQGELLLDDFVYVYIRDNLSYRYAITPDVKTAYEVEKAVQDGALEAGKPFLNPLPIRPRPSKQERAAMIRALKPLL